MDALALIDDWPVDTAAVGVASAEGVLARRGPADRVLAWASVTKLVTAGAVLVAAEEGIVELDEPAGPPGSTLRHLLAHASGLPLDGDAADREAGDAADLLERGDRGRRGARRRAGRDAVRRLPDRRRPRAGRAARRASTGRPRRRSPGRSTISWRSAASCSRRGFSRRRRSRRRRASPFPGLSGVLPGYGKQDPNDWGLGFELRDGKAPHWTGARNSPRTFGHFGRAGTFLWVDPEAGLALRVPHRPRLRRLVARGLARARRRGARRVRGYFVKSGRRNSSKVARSQLATVAGRDRVDRCGAADVHEERHLAEVAAGAQHRTLAPLVLRGAQEPGEHDVEPVALLALRDDALAGREVAPLHPLAEPASTSPGRPASSSTCASSCTVADCRLTTAILTGRLGRGCVEPERPLDGRLRLGAERGRGRLAVLEQDMWGCS